MSSDTALLIIDTQVGLMKDAYQRDAILEKIALLLEQARNSGVPVLYVQHSEDYEEGLKWGTPNWEIHPAIAPRQGEVIIHKESPDSFHRTTLQEELEKQDIKRLVIVGGQTEYCVDSTVRRSVAEGYDVLLVSDAHTTYDSRTLTAAQIIDFVNGNLKGFWAGEHRVDVKPTNEIALSDFVQA